MAADHSGYGLDDADIIQEANMGLIQAAENFDPDAGRFATFAMIWIRSEEHTSELQSLMRISYAVFCLKKKKTKTKKRKTTTNDHISIQNQNNSITQNQR